MNQQAVKGKFSLRTVLSTNDELVQHPSFEQDVGFDESTDPISLGLINFPVAVSLFEEYVAQKYSSLQLYAVSHGSF